MRDLTDCVRRQMAQLARCDIGRTLKWVAPSGEAGLSCFSSGAGRRDWGWGRRSFWKVLSRVRTTGSLAAK